MTTSVAAIWYPEFRVAVVGAVIATPLVIPVATVVATTYAVGGVIAFAAADTDDPGWYGVEALKEYYHDPLGTTYDIIVEEAQEVKREIAVVATLVYHQVKEDIQRKVNLLGAGVKDIAEKYGELNRRFLTGPYLPF